ncbi:oligosaccharide flippase family protein [Streptococcus sp. sy010]|uniref:oligosaccharide flippase family protein n=1 Tax=Streptococcus sp. sy010 TaxID=2600148 RepID=UPI0011B718AA|nr:oligosaccharide flippase family protein [Streptococcus sp. sy010]TWT14433.1 oligosaccharide flippase family protein [Streptococcus sp. sy010]
MAKTFQSVRVNFIMNFILTISNFIFPLITFPYASRVLGASGVGTVTFASSIISYFSMVGMLGIPTYAIRACAKVRDDQKKLEKTVQEVMLLNFLVMLVAIFFLLISIFSIDRFAQEKTLYLILSSTLIFNVLGVDWLYRALERYTYITIRSIIFKFLALILLLLLVKTTDDYVLYGAISVLASVGSNLLNFLNLRRIINLKPSEKLNLRPHIRPSLTFFLLSVSAIIYQSVDTTLLGFMAGNEAVGYYSAAVRLKQILVGVVTSLGAVLMPRLSNYIENGRHEEFQRLLQKAINFVFVASLPLAVYFILLAKESILFLSGDGFLPSVLPLQLIIPSIVFIGFSNVMGFQVLVPTNREILVVYSTIAGAVVDLILNLFLIPLFDASGTAFSSSAAEFVVVLVQVYLLRELIPTLLKQSSLTKALGSVVIASVVTLLVKPLLSGVFLTLVITALLFFSSYSIVLLLTKEKFITELVTSLVKKYK